MRLARLLNIISLMVLVVSSAIAEETFADEVKTIVEQVEFDWPISDSRSLDARRRSLSLAFLIVEVREIERELKNGHIFGKQLFLKISNLEKPFCTLMIEPEDSDRPENLGGGLLFWPLDRLRVGSREVSAQLDEYEDLMAKVLLLRKSPVEFSRERNRLVEWGKELLRKKEDKPRLRIVYGCVKPPPSKTNLFWNEPGVEEEDIRSFLTQFPEDKGWLGTPWKSKSEINHNYSSISSEEDAWEERKNLLLFTSKHSLSELRMKLTRFRKVVNGYKSQSSRTPCRKFDPFDF